MKKSVLLILGSFLLFSCSAESIEEDILPVNGYYGIVVKTECETTPENHTRYCVTEETYRNFEVNSPEFCQMVTFRTKTGTIVSGLYSGISYGSDPIPCKTE